MGRTVALRRRFLCAVLALVFSVAALFLFLPGKALAPVPTLKVYAQYWADPDSATLLGEYTRAELEELADSEAFGYEGYYSNVTRVHTVMRVHARGVKLQEFLRDKVGVDLNSVRQLDFHTTDVGENDRFVSKGRYELLDMPHYYYPNLVANSHYDRETDSFVVDDEEAAAADAVEVPTLLAVTQYATKNPLDDLSDEMTTEDTFRLCAGSPDLTTVTSFESARAVDAIYVVFAGSPPEPSSEEPSSESPTKGSPDQDSTNSPTEPATTAQPATRGSAVVPTSRNTQSTATTAAPTRATVTTTRTVPRTITTRPPGGGTSAVREEKMGQLVVNGYDSMIQWKQESPDDVSALQKPVVTTRGARNAILLFVLSFAAGAAIMFNWFIKEK